jgi:ParB family chromosome partitioning protein
MDKKSGLGRGLSSLLYEEIKADTGVVIELSIFDVEPNPDQPRKQFDESSLKSLSESISEVGVLSPILVRKKDNGLYEIIAGERRWRASKLAGKKKIPAIVRNYENKEVMEIALIENLQREDLNPYEEAIGYQVLRDDFNLTQEDISKKVCKSRSTIANILRILKLPEFVLTEVKKGTVSTGHTKALNSLESDELKKLLLFEIVKNGISVREAEEHAKRLSQKKRTTIIKRQFKKDPNMLQIENSLTKKLGTKVQIKSGKIKSKIEIEYYSEKDLQRIIDTLGIQS